MKKLKTWQFVLLIIFYPIGIVYFCVWLYKRNKSKQSPPISNNYTSTLSPTTTPASATPAPKPRYNFQLPDGEKDYDIFPPISNGYALKYEYENPLTLLDGAINIINGNGGKEVEFKQEPDNPNDDQAVAVYFNGVKIGYVDHELNKKMINDYIKKDLPIVGYINKYSVAENKATYKTGYYKPLSELPSKKFTLVKTKKKLDDDRNRAENLTYFTSVGDVLTVEYDEINEQMIVYNSSYDEIGELPKSAVDFIEDNSYKHIVGILESCDTDIDNNLNEKIKAVATIYLA